MSLAIDTDTVSAVLLADGWHQVTARSFDLDAYEFVWEGETLLGGGNCAGVPSTGFSFTTTDGSTVAGPLTALLAVRRDGCTP